MKLVYFDLCSIAVFVLVIWTCIVRNMTKSRAEKLFLMISGISLACAILDVWMEYVVNPVPLSQSAVVLGTAISTLYKFLHNSTLLFYLIFIFVITRTVHKVRSKRAHFMLYLPAVVLAVILIQNLFTGNVFSVSMQDGYVRGPLLISVYIIAAIYGFVGMGYCFTCRRYLNKDKWTALVSVYAIIFAAVIAEFLVPQLLIEMFAIAIGILIVQIMVMRPEETKDGYVSVKTRRAYEADLRNAILSGDSVQIVIIQLSNAREIRSYRGEKRYYAYINEIVEEIRRLYSMLSVKHLNMEMYLERPGSIYLILDDPDYDMRDVVSAFVDGVRARTGEFTEMGVQFEPHICTIRIPDEMNDPDEIIELGHKFMMLGSPDSSFYSASELMEHPDFNSIVHMEEILNRAVTEDSLKVLYQPIYNVRERRFDSVEALSRLIDREYGMISPALFIPASESNGIILRLGEMILESVFRFISENDLDELGLSYVEINLSVAQMMQPKLPAILERLQSQYGVSPSQVNFEITESMFDNISSVITENVQALSKAGYSFSLDDYGTGYSSIQRMNQYPLRLIKIDKSMADAIFTESGNVIMFNTIRMMHDIHKKLVVEGVETEAAKDALTDMSCDYIQGFYYSRPLGEEDLVEFLKKHNRKKDKASGSGNIA